MAQARRIIQHHVDKDDMLSVVCSDGTLWYINKFNEWDEFKVPPIPQPEVTVKGKRVIQCLPKNFDGQFEILWISKGRTGSKSKAREKYAKMSQGESDNDLVDFTTMLVTHMEWSNSAIGFPELHLITYLNQQRWES